MDLNHYQPNSTTLKDKVILVTGAGSGLGRSLALTLAQAGATIILLGRLVKKLEKVYDEIEANNGPQPAIFPLDLAKASEEDYVQLATALHENFQRLDGLILNAAILGQHSPVTHLNLEQWQQALQVNLTANFLLLKHCSATLNVGEKSSVLYISDSLAKQSCAYWGCYAPTKAAMENLIQTTADEWETNTSIYLNSFDPGPLRTNLRRQAYPGEDADTIPPPESVCLPVTYLMDAAQNWPRAERLCWDPQAKLLTKN